MTQHASLYPTSLERAVDFSALIVLMDEYQTLRRRIREFLDCGTPLPRETPAQVSLQPFKLQGKESMSLSQAKVYLREMRTQLRRVLGHDFLVAFLGGTSLEEIEESVEPQYVP